MPIPGGFYIKARCIQESWIAHAAPVVRETWDYLLREANHKPKKYDGFIVKRGQLFRTYGEIREALYWQIGFRKQLYTVNQMKHTMKLLTNNAMLQLTSKPRGMLITVCNYEKYQTISNYESTNGSPVNQPMGQPRINQASTPINKNVKNKEKTPPNPDVKIFIDFAFKTFKDIFGMPLNITGGKDATLVKKLLGTYSLEQLKELWNNFLATEDKFTSGAGRSINVFYSQINKLISKNKAKKTKPRVAV